VLHKFCLGLALLFAVLGAVVIIGSFIEGGGAVGVPLGLVLFFLSWIAWRVVKADKEAKEEELFGIGGWLIVLAVGQVVGPLSFLGSVVRNYSELADYEAVMNIAVLIIMLSTTILFFRQSRLFPRFFLMTWAAVILLYPLDVILTAAVLSVTTGQPFGSFITQMIDAGLVMRWIALIISATIWISYVRHSRRVANTFSPRPI
jgi:hypothetical protein